MRHRNARVSRRCHRRADTRHFLERQSFHDQCLRFLAAAPENIRVTALEPHHALAFLRFGHQQRVDLVLLQFVTRAALAGVNNLRLRRTPAQQRRIRQVVIDHHLRLPQTFRAAQRQQSRIARTCANQINNAFHFKIVFAFSASVLPICSASRASPPNSQNLTRPSS